MDFQKYLNRIGCSGPCPPTIETLRTIHLNHLLTVPFEDLTIHMGERVSLELPSLYEKIVLKNRGGFCYENNGLFSWLLIQLGFDVDILAAQVKNRLTSAYGPPFDHLIIMVTLDGHRWLCDVGFGCGFQLPLSLEIESQQCQSQGVYRVRTQGKLIYMEMQSESDIIKDPKENSAWKELYKFTLEPCQRDDFKAMCDYHQSSVNSIFFCKSLCSLLLPNGRITLIGRKLILTSLPSAEGQPVKTKTDLSDEEITELLKETFGIVLSSSFTIKDIEIVPPPNRDVFKKVSMLNSGSLRLVKLATALGVSGTLYFMSGTVIAASDAKERSDSSLMIEELSLYTTPHSQVKYVETEVGHVEHGIASLRRTAEPYTVWCQEFYKTIEPGINVSIRTARDTYEFLNSPPPEFYPGVGVVGFSGILGLYLAKGRSVKRMSFLLICGCRVKGLLFPAGLMALSASMLYPQQASSVAKAKIFKRQMLSFSGDERPVVQLEFTGSHGLGGAVEGKMRHIATGGPIF
ncbi:hypothetical protein P4O66_005045 [Electrophorus voltai]|uniref:MICOS complex subunit n=1 Tax=Electrophorus voltai TaxID=2609070 RepID=A0AAD8ZW74_9TELE|nr:hypothetical protein P4O66_005045 [Electrophorus voltai]